MSIAHVDPLRLDERALAFRLAPRINAAGRLYRADSALELLLTDDADRARELAAELDHANAERRHVETRIRFEAESLAAAAADAPAFVLAAPGWHPGVIGIVAARIAERHHRPVVMIALPAEGEDGLASGSGRSIPAFDLLGGLDAASEHLERHGGHRAAAGLTIEPEHVEAFREAFVAHARTTLSPDDLRPVERVDAVASGEDVGLALAEELAQLAPFGAGNPAISLILPAATLSEPIGFGGDDRSDHARFTVTSGAGKARAVCFGSGARLSVPCDEPVDATFTLERNEWRGVVEPRLILRRAAVCRPPAVELLGEDGDFLERAFAELDGDFVVESPPLARPRTVFDHRGGGIAALITRLRAAGEDLLVVVSDAPARARHLDGRLGGFSLASYAALARDPEIARAFPAAVALDPATGERDAAIAGEPGARTYLAWGAAELRFAGHIHEREYGLRSSLAGCFRALRDRGGAAGRELETVLREEAASPEHAGRLLRVLTEVGLVALDRERVSVAVTERGRVSLEQSAAYLHYERLRQDGLRYLGLTTAKAA
jgi:single-stranded-DNA-specific exonuclease